MLKKKKSLWQGAFPGGAVVKNPPASAGDMGSSPSLEDPTSPWATTTSPSAVEPASHSY